MSQLTTINKLRRSSAMQSRVENVMRYLQTLNRDWNADWVFPIAVINVSNDQADCSWVRQHSSTHIKPTEVLKIGDRILTADHIIEALKNFRAASATDFVTLNEVLKTAVGVTVNWTHGMVVQPQEVAAEPTPFAQSAQKEASQPASSSSTQPVAQASTRKTSGSTATAKRSGSIKPIATRPAKETKLDQAKKLFSDLTPKQKVELSVWVQEKVGASKACRDVSSKGVQASLV